MGASLSNARDIANHFAQQFGRIADNDAILLHSFIVIPGKLVMIAFEQSLFIAQFVVPDFASCGCASFAGRCGMTMCDTGFATGCKRTTGRLIVISSSFSSKISLPTDGMVVPAAGVFGAFGHYWQPWYGGHHRFSF